MMLDTISTYFTITTRGRVVLARLHFSIIFQSLSNLLTGAMMENSAIRVGREADRHRQTEREVWTWTDRQRDGGLVKEGINKLYLTKAVEKKFSVNGPEYQLR